MSHNIKPGVATGRAVQEIFKYAKEKGFALPAVNVIGSSSINGVLETARDLNAPVIIQFSNGGGVFNAGKGLSNEGQKAAIAGSVAGAKHIHLMAEAYGVPVILLYVFDFKSKFNKVTLSACPVMVANDGDTCKNLMNASKRDETGSAI